MPWLHFSESQITGGPACSASRLLKSIGEHAVFGDVDPAAGVDHSNGAIRLLFETRAKSASARMIAQTTLIDRSASRK